MDKDVKDDTLYQKNNFIEEENLEKDNDSKNEFDDFGGKERFYVKTPKEDNPKKKNIASSFLNIFDKLTIGVEKADSKLNVGDRVKIINGFFTNEVLIITAFIVGGIQGRIRSGKVINIRHGSYDTEESF